jgi:hypothetical protein
VEDRWCKVWFGREEHEFMAAYMAGIGPVLEIACSYHFASGAEYSIFMYISTHHPHTLNTILSSFIIPKDAADSTWSIFLENFLNYVCCISGIIDVLANLQRIPELAGKVIVNSA